MIINKINTKTCFSFKKFPQRLHSSREFCYRLRKTQLHKGLSFVFRLNDKCNKLSLVNTNIQPGKKHLVKPQHIYLVVLPVSLIKDLK